MTQMTIKDLENVLDKKLDEKLKVNNTNLKEDFRKELQEQFKVNNTNLKEDVRKDIHGLKIAIDEQLKVNSRNIKEGIREEIQVATRDIISHFNASQGEQNNRLDELAKQFKEFKGEIHELKDIVEDMGEDVSKVKLAVLDILSTDRHLHNLVHELQEQGITLSHEKIFAE